MACAQAGADIALTYHRNEGGAQLTEQAIRRLGRRVAVFQTDLADESSVGQLADRAYASMKHLDVWVNNAGADILTGPAVSLSTLEKLDRLLAVDLRGTMLASWKAVEVMKTQDEGGVVINMSWDHALSGMEGLHPQLFAAVKGGVLAFSKSLARTVAPRVRVNVLAPGWIETSFGQSLDETRRDAVADTTPLKRWGTPEDVAAAAVFLASPAAAFLTGQTIFVGGGVVM